MTAPPGRFTQGSTMGHVVRMTLTGAVGITFVFAVDAANLYWLAQLNDAQLLAAMGYVFAVQFFSISVGVGMMIAATVMVSRQIGAGRLGDARQSASSAMVLTAATQGAVALLLILFRHQILALSGASGDTAALAARYLAISLPSLVIMAVGLVGSGTLRAQGDGRRAMYVTLASGCVALVVDPYLIYVLEWGLDGAALGVVVSRVIMAAVALYFATQRHDLLARPQIWAVRDAARSFFSIALPAIATQLSLPISSYILTKIIAAQGEDAVAVWAVINRVTVLAFGGIFALAGAIGGIFGQNYGAHNFARLRSAYRDALIFAVIYSMIIWAVLIAFTPVLVRAFALPADGIGLFAAFTHVTVGSFILASGIYVANASFNALGHPGRSTLLNWLRDAGTVLSALWLAPAFAAFGVLYAQAAVGAVLGLLAGVWGYSHVRGLHRRALDGHPPQL